MRCHHHMDSEDACSRPCKLSRLHRGRCDCLQHPTGWAVRGNTIGENAECGRSQLSACDRAVAKKESGETAKSGKLEGRAVAKEAREAHHPPSPAGAAPSADVSYKAEEEHVDRTIGPVAGESDGVAEHRENRGVASLV